MPLTVSVYRNADSFYPDCTLGGESSRSATILLLGCDGPTTEEDNAKTHEYPVLKVVRQARTGRIIAMPKHAEPVPGRYAFGGNFLFCSDSRFAALNDGLPIPVHDRDLRKERP